MKEVSLTKFKDHSLQLFGKDKKLRVNVRGGKYILMFLHDIKDDMFVERDGDVLIDKHGKRFRECRLCGSLWNVRYIIPYDGSKEPGPYCYYCRRKHSIMDVKDAKRYGKIL